MIDKLLKEGYEEIKIECGDYKLYGKGNKRVCYNSKTNEVLAEYNIGEESE